MHTQLNDEIERMGYDARQVMKDLNTDQDFLIMSRLMKLTRTGDFSEEELTYYQWASEEQEHVCRGRIQTPDFTEEELKEYQWAAEHPTGSCRGFRMTEEPSEQEVKEWLESLDYLNKLNIDEARSRVKFIDRVEEKPYTSDNPFEEFFTRSWENVVASCSLGNDPYRMRD